MIQEVLRMEKFAKENGPQLSGHILGIVERAATGKEEIVVDQHNLIGETLKMAMRDTMHANVDLALDDLQATQVAKAAMSAALDGKDGILILKFGGVMLADIVAFMASAVHPTDPSGDFYRQWQGVYQNLTGGDEDVGNVQIGHAYTYAVAPSWPFGNGVEYARNGFASVTLLDKDIITINWKITVG